jgi:hypothetical protein
MVLLAVAALGTSLAAFAADPAITVSARQRYPWNGLVDINFIITGDAGTKYDISFTAKDMVGNTNIAMRTIRKSNGVAAAAKEQLLPGTHNWVWDAAADLPKDFKCDRVTVTGTALEMKLYMVIDLSSGSNSSSYPVSYLDAVPSGGWSDTYKTTKLVLRKCNAGSFKMQGTTTTKLTKAFYIGIFEMTQKQYSLVTGSNPTSASGVGNAYPVHYVSYNMIRGASNGSKWPSSGDVDLSSFMGRLRARTGCRFDLPTEAQWEYACRAGTTTKYCCGDSVNGNYMWYGGNSNDSSQKVGTKKANSWGIYDMHGNVWEWCLDWKGTLQYGTDPKGPTSGTQRVRRGGSWPNQTLDLLSSSYHGGAEPTNNLNVHGFRVCLTLE